MSDSEELQEILRSLSVEQLRFVSARVQCSSDAEAMRKVGISKRTVWMWGEPVKRAVQLIALDGVATAREILRRAVIQAAEVKVSGLESNRESVKQLAATDILNRQLGLPTQTINQQGSVSVVIPGLADMLDKIYGADESKD